MKDLDNKLREALREQFGDEGANEPLDPGLIDMTIGVFRSRNRWVTVMVFLVSIALFGVMVWSVFRFFDADTTKWQIFYATLFMYLVLAISLLKVWFWMEMQRAAVTRELKRMELQLARVSSRLASLD